MKNDDVVKLLRAAIAEAGGLRSWARQHGVDPGYIAGVLAGRRPAGKSILRGLGLRRIVTYTLVDMVTGNEERGTATLNKATGDLWRHPKKGGR